MWFITRLILTNSNWKPQKKIELRYCCQAEGDKRWYEYLTYTVHMVDPPWKPIFLSFWIAFQSSRRLFQHLLNPLRPWGSFNNYVDQIFPNFVHPTRFFAHFKHYPLFTWLFTDHSPSSFCRRSYWMTHWREEGLAKVIAPFPLIQQKTLLKSLGNIERAIFTWRGPCTRVAIVVAHHNKLLTQWRYI